MRRHLILAFALVGLAACGIRDPAFVQHRLVAMATTVEIQLPTETSEKFPDLIAAIEADLREFERDYYAWSDGELRRLNLALSATGAFEASPDMAALLTRARAFAVATEGAFDPGVGTLVELWGFNDATELPTRPPTDTAIATALRVSGSG
jgi:thiamine biosynthesis lipoprotein